MTCEVPKALAVLGPFNSHAWRVYSQAVTRLAFDGGATGAVLVRLLEPLDADAFADCWARLLVLHDVLNPPRTPTRMRARGEET